MVHRREADGQQAVALIWRSGELVDDPFHTRQLMLVHRAVQRRVPDRMLLHGALVPVLLQ